MANIKDLKIRIKSVKSTQKITKAMKMVAAAKLRKARTRAEEALPFAEKMDSMLKDLAAGVSFETEMPKLFSGTGKDNVHLIIVATGDRGLCGAFNSSIVRAAKRLANELQEKGKKVQFLCVGKKSYEQLKPTHGDKIIGKIEGGMKGQVEYRDAEKISNQIIQAFEAGEFDVCTLIYNKFKSAISQIVTVQQLVPVVCGEKTESSKDYEYEPSKQEILNALLPKNISVQIYKALLENAASEQGARMTAMENASNNAGEMIKDLTLLYNRTRQASITKELIEIISGAESV